MYLRKLLLLSLVAIIVFISLAFVLYSCSGNGGSGSGTVAVYVTDDPMWPNLFSQITATINGIQLISAGTSTVTCDLLTSPVTINIANLAEILQLVNVTQCPEGPFNRIHIEFDKELQLVSEETATTEYCSFVSYKSQGSQNKPNVLDCTGTICTLNINGAVNVLAQQSNKLALDFDLKEFEIASRGTPSCGVTMKVSPLNASQFKGMEAVTGIVSNLDTTNKTFDLAGGNRTFSVLYSAITDSDQPGLDLLLQRAQDDRLRTKVMSSNIDIMNNTINASSILVKVEGIVSNLVSGSTFTVVYQNGAKTIDVDYSDETEVSGTVQEDSWVDVKLYGNAGSDDSRFLAREVEVETMGMMTED